MQLLTLVLLIVGFFCFVLAACRVAVGKLDLIAAGLACWLLTAVLANLAK